MSKTYEQYRNHLRKIADINNAIAVLHWDQETYLPAKGAAQRASQIATLSGLSHELMTSTELGDMLKTLSSDTSLSERESRNVAETAKDFERQQKLPTDFVIKKAKATSAAFQAWVKARKEDDFSIFEQPLTDMVAIKREEAELVGYTDHPYDALLDEYEPGEKTADLVTLFADVRAQLVDFIKEISQQPRPEDGFMYKHFDKDKQWKFGIDLLTQMGYDFKAGRQDLAAHPFTTSFGASDVRVTTRVNENDFHEMTWSCIHEGGHALYEQGLLDEDYGLPTGSSVSLGIHESQSRLWENNVGRSLPYWKGNYGTLQTTFPESLDGVTAEDFYKAMNLVQPSLIRTNADELTYHSHIMVRFEIEKALIEGSIEVKDLPTVWNAKYKEYLGIDVPSDAQGVLQDIHWSHGSFGYFPTYSLGSFYAAQFFHQATKDIPGLESQIQAGDMSQLLEWLRTHIHQYGRFYSAEEFCKRITGEKLNFKYFMDYAKEKYGGIYGL